MRLRAESSALLVVDWQDKLCKAMPPEAEARGRKNVGILIEAARLLGVPVVVSEQYPQGLGRTLPDVWALAEAAAAQRVEKVTFACTNDSAFQALATALGPRSWVVSGMESHVCVWQTVRGLLEIAPFVHVVADAVLSRAEENRAIGVGLCREAGATVTSTETVAFDWLGKAGSDAFKAISRLVR